jgi:GT2 family glycosyltransferase
MLHRLLTALEAQASVPGGFELVVVDDGSSDDTEQIVQRCSLHPRYVRQENQGPAAARNAGWRLARGAIVAFTDDDTVPDRRWLADLIAAFADQSAPDAVGGRIVALERGLLADFVQLEGQVDHSIDDHGQVRYLVTANAGWRREALEALDGFDESFPLASGEDTDLSMRAIRSGLRLATIDAAVVAHDHRATLRSVLSTFGKHGRSREQVVAANPDMEWRRRRLAVLGPRDWARRYKKYRSGGCGRLRSTLYLGLRAAGLISYAAGVVKALHPRRTSAPA